MIWMRVLWLLPVLWILLATKMLAFSSRTLLASLMGLTLPYWLVGCYLVYTHRLTEHTDYLLTIASVDALADFASLPIMVTLTIIFVLLMGVLGMCHYLHTSYNDRISTRMIYEFLVIMQIVLSVFIVLQPQSYVALLPLLIVNTSPLIAHFLALSHTKTSNVTFLVIAAASVALIICNLILC